MTTWIWLEFKAKVQNDLLLWYVQMPAIGFQSTFWQKLYSSCFCISNEFHLLYVLKKTYEGFTCKHSGIDYTRSCMGKQNAKIYSTSCTLKHRLEQGISHTHGDSADCFHRGKQNSFFLLWSFWYLANANKPQWEQFEDESIRKTLST